MREIVEPNKLGAQLMAGTSCLHIPGFRRTTTGHDWAGLLERELAGLREVLASSDPQPVVLLAHSWVGQARKAVAIGPAGAPLPGPVTPEQMVEGLVRLRDTFEIDHLVVLGQVPRPPFDDLFEQLQRPALSRQIDAAMAKEFDLTAEVEQNNAVLRAGAERTGAYEYLDPVAALSKDGHCLAIADSGELIYSDATHLSKAGSLMVMRSAADRLLHLVKLR